MPVQLIIKSAVQNVEDFKLNCEMSSTIAEVKNQITESYPTNPAREHQKLIYGGKLLPDHLPLKSILNQGQDIHIFHLVYPLPSKSESSKSHSNKGKSVPPACTVPPLNSSGIYPQMNQQLQTPTFTSVSSGVGGAFAAAAPADAVHQYFAMQQMYTQFMTQYLSQYNGTTPYGQVPATIPPVQQPEPEAPQQNLNQNADARPVGERWDLIDFLYLLSRATMLFALLIYYSSPTRVIAVCVLVFLLTLFAKLNRERQREEIGQANERQTTENIAPEGESEQGTAEDAENTEMIPENELSDSQLVSSPPQAHVHSALSVPSIIASALTSFFTSLIPADPVPVNVN